MIYLAKFVALVSGKGGTGKTTSALNLGQAFINTGKKAIVVDANLTTPNLALHLGVLQPKSTLNQFLRKESSLNDILHAHPCGLSFIPASPSYAEFKKTDSAALGSLFNHLENLADVIVVDAPSGLGQDVEHVLRLCDEALVVANPTPSSMMDALKTIKLAENNETPISGVLLNMSHNGRHELSVKEVEEILGHAVIANVKHHRKFRKALHQQVPLAYKYKRSGLSKEFTKVANYLSLEQNG